MRKVLFISVMLTLGACGETAAVCPIDTQDGGTSDGGSTSAWRCTGVFAVTGGPIDTFALTDEPAEVYVGVGANDEMPADAVRAQFALEGCTFTVIPGNGHGHALTEGAFDMENPPWAFDAADPDCASFEVVDGRVWRRRALSDEPAFMLEHVALEHTDGRRADADIVCAPVE